MAYWKLVTAEEPKHAIKASLRAGGTGRGPTKAVHSTKGSEFEGDLFGFTGSIGRKWLGDFSTRRPGGPEGHETCREKCVALWAEEFGSKALYGALRTSLSAQDRGASLLALTR